MDDHTRRNSNLLRLFFCGIAIYVILWYISCMTLTKKELAVCRFCGYDKRLMIYASYHGRNYLMCRKCNTEKLKKYRKTPEGAEKFRNAIYKSIERNRYKHNARVMVWYALKKGTLHRPKHCSVCKKEKKPYAHHEDYGKPLEVIWLCRQCHSDLHRSL